MSAAREAGNPHIGVLQQGGALDRLHRVVAHPGVLAAIVAVNLAAYLAGAIFWYGPMLTDAETPAWAWVFIPDCPLFALLGGLGLLMVSAQRFWSQAAQRTVQTWLVAAGAAALAAWPLLRLLERWGEYGSVCALLGGSLLLCGLLFRRAPAWLICVLAAAQIKYGIWTLTAWGLFWRNTNVLFGSPAITPESVVMTVTHVGLIVQGLLLLSYVAPTWSGVLAVLAGLGLSDFVDYGLGWYPPVPPIIPLAVMRSSTIAVTWILGIGLALLAARVQARGRGASLI